MLTKYLQITINRFSFFIVLCLWEISEINQQLFSILFIEFNKKNNVVNNIYLKIITCNIHLFEMNIPEKKCHRWSNEEPSASISFQTWYKKPDSSVFHLFYYINPFLLLLFNSNLYLLNTYNETFIVTTKLFIFYFNHIMYMDINY